MTPFCIAFRVCWPSQDLFLFFSLCSLLFLCQPTKTDVYRAGEPSYVDPSYLCIDDSPPLDRKSTRLNSSHANISYAVFCLKKKKQNNPANSAIRAGPCQRVR